MIKRNYFQWRNVDIYLGINQTLISDLSHLLNERPGNEI